MAEISASFLMTLGVILVFISGLLLKDNFLKEASTFKFFTFLIATLCGPVIILIAAVYLHYSATGKFALEGKLSENAIYEVISSTPIKNSDASLSYGLIIKDQEDQLLSFMLKEDPPKIFKVKETKDKEKKYEPYPPKEP